MKNILKIILVFLNTVFVFFIALGMLLNPSMNTDKTFFIFGILGAVASILLIIFYLVSLIKDPQTFMKKNAENFFNNFRQDFFFLKFCVKHPLYIIPYIFSLLFIAVFFINEIVNKTVWGLLPFDGIANIILYVYACLFITISIYMCGYLFIGEVFQRKYSKPKRLFIIDLVIDYIFAVPFIIILTIFFLLFLLLSQSGKKKKDGGVDFNFRSFPVYIVCLIAKYFTYLNLASIAYEDERFITSIKKTFNFFKENAKDLLLIFAKNGMIFLYPVFIGLNLFVWDFVFMIDPNIIYLIIGAIFGMFFLYRLFSEQIILLIFYVTKIKNNEEIKDFEGLFQHKKIDNDINDIDSEITGNI